MQSLLSNRISLTSCAHSNSYFFTSLTSGSVVSFFVSFSLSIYTSQTISSIFEHVEYHSIELMARAKESRGPNGCIKPRDILLSPKWPYGSHLFDTLNSLMGPKRCNITRSTWKSLSSNVFRPKLCANAVSNYCPLCNLHSYPIELSHVGFKFLSLHQTRYKEMGV